MLTRRKFILGSSAIVLSNLVLFKEADAWLFFLRMASAGRHMSRFGRAGSRLKYAGQLKSKSKKQRKTYGLTSKQLISISRNARLIKKFSEIIYDNKDVGFPRNIEEDVSALCGGNDEELFCTAFSTSNDPVVFELPELIMLEALGEHLPKLYKKEFGGSVQQSNKNILSCIHPIGKIKDGEYDNEWNHITPLIYKTSCGKVTMEIMETSGRCIVERYDIKQAYIIPIQFSSTNIITGQRT